MLDKESLKPVIESLLFAAENAVSLERIAGALEGEDRATVKEALAELVEEYRSRGGGFFIEEVAGGYQFRTSPEFAPWLRRFFKIGLQRISKAAMESLAVVAYKQPVTRGELEAIRGVDSGGVLATLMEKRFIRIVGRKEVPGRPVVYGTTKEFLETFELRDLSCLPSLKDLKKMEEEYAQEQGQGAAEDAVQEQAQEGAGISDAEGGPQGPEEDAQGSRQRQAPESGEAPEAPEAPETPESGEAPKTSEAAEAPETSEAEEDGHGGLWDETDEAERPAGAGQAPEDNSRRRGDFEEEG